MISIDARITLIHPLEVTLLDDNGGRLAKVDDPAISIDVSDARPSVSVNGTYRYQDTVQAFVSTFYLDPDDMKALCRAYLANHGDES